MKTHLDFTSCLSFEKITSYISNVLPKIENEQIYMHITQCELCACAVNGFSASPINISEVNSLNKIIDTKSKNSFIKPNIITYSFVTLTSLVAIFSFYLITDLPSKAEMIKTTINIKNIYGANNFKEMQNQTSNSIENGVVVFKQNNDMRYQKPFKKITSYIPLIEVNPKPINFISLAINNNQQISYQYNSNITYINNFKVSNYKNLYFIDIDKNIDELLNNTPALIENENKQNIDLTLEEQAYESNQLLIQGLYYLDKEKYKKAFTNFYLLMEHNKNDINARFYSALCLYNLDKTDKSIELFNEVLINENDTFYPEAQWYLALNHIKIGDNEKAKTLLRKIISEEGFYVEKAKEELKKINL